LGNLSFDPNQTVTDLGDAVNNNVWTSTQNAGFYIFRSNTTIAAGDVSSFVFKLTITPGASLGVIPISVFLSAGSGGETFFDNNSDSEVLRYFPPDDD
jgi:hypothetical protein